MDSSILSEFEFCWYISELFNSAIEVLVNSNLGFYVLVVHRQSIDSLSGENNIFHFLV